MVSWLSHADTPTCMLTSASILSLFQRLLEHKNAPELMSNSDRYGNEPLHVAAMNGFLTVARVRNKQAIINESKLYLFLFTLAF